MGCGARRGRGGNGPSGEFPENASPLSFLLGRPGWRPRGGAQPGWLSAHGSEWTRGGGWRCSGGGLSLHTLALTLLWVPWLPPPHREAVHGPALAPAHSPSVPRGAWGTSAPFPCLPQGPPPRIQGALAPCSSRLQCHLPALELGPERLFLVPCPGVGAVILLPPPPRSLLGSP